MLTLLLQILHIFVCSVLMFVVLLQQGKGGGMGALGGGGTAQVFGGRGAGNILTRATAVAATTFMLTSVSLAYISSSGDRALKARAALEDQKRADKSAHKDDKAKAAPSSSAPATTAPVDSAASSPVPPPAPAPSP